MEYAISFLKKLGVGELITISPSKANIIWQINPVLMRNLAVSYGSVATLSGIELHHMLRKGQHKASANKAIFEQFYALAA